VVNVKKIPAILWYKFRWDTNWRKVRIVIKFWIAVAFIIYALSATTVVSAWIAVIGIFLIISYIFYHSI
jgi:hypothetical protein